MAKGVSPLEVIAELFGRQAGVSQGRGGSMHLFAPEVGLMGTSGIVGPCILQAVGAGYSFKLLKTDQIAVAFFGDGAVNNGAFHEGLNLASIWQLPVLFICENNQFATEVPFKYASGIEHVGRRATAYGLPGAEVDGNDVLAVYETVDKAVRRARGGEGATLIECKTYRTRAHAEGMIDFTYRSREEVDRWKSRCPIEKFKHSVIEQGLASVEELDEMELEIADQIRADSKQAESGEFPTAKSAATHVFAGPADVGNNKLPGTVAGRHVEPSVESDTRQITYMAATLEALGDAMREDPTIFVMGEGAGVRGGNFNTTTGLFDLYGPERLCDTPICERGFVGLTAGAAMTGTRPVIDFMFTDFILDAVGEIVNQIAKMQYMSSGRLTMPVLLRGCFGAGHSAATHHSGSYYSTFAHFPGLKVVLPATPFDAKGLFATALRSDDPVLFLEHRELLTHSGPVPEMSYEIPFGKANVVRSGRDVTVLAVAHMVPKTLQAMDQLNDLGISVELIDPRTVAPLDIESILASVGKTGRLLIAEETFGPFGLGAEVSALVVQHAFDHLDAPIHRLHGVHTPTPYSPPLEKEVIPQVDDIIQAVQELCDE